MERFLGHKSTRKHPSDVLVMTLSFLFVVFCLVSVLTYPEDQTFNSVILALFLALIFGFPGLDVLLRRMDVAKAGRYAKYLANAPESSIDVDQLRTDMKDVRADKALESMLVHEYLQGVYIDHTHAKVIIEHFDRSERTDRITVACPQCGASNTVAMGQTAACSMCGAVLPNLGDQ